MQLGFADVGVNPTHWHVVQGFRDDDRFEEGLSPYRSLETLCSNHLTQEQAISQLQAWISETEYFEGRVPVTPVAVDGDRADYDQGTEEDCAEYWLRVVRCESFACYKGCSEDGVWREFPGT